MNINNAQMNGTVSAIGVQKKKLIGGVLIRIGFVKWTQKLSRIWKRQWKRSFKYGSSTSKGSKRTERNILD
jgi:hypothetical protein